MKTIIVTGVTGSIGKAVAQALAQRGNIHLILAGRSAARLEELQNELQGKTTKVDTLPLDLSDTVSVGRAVETIKADYQAIDALVNIAAVYKAQKALSAQGHELMFATNHLGPFAFTTGLLPLLKATPGAKVLTVTAPSTTKIDFGNLNGEKKFSALTAFGASKMMNLLFTFQLAKEFGSDKQVSMAFHPGLVKSDLMSDVPALFRGLLRLVSSLPQKAGAAIATLILNESAALQNGKFFNSNGKELKPTALAQDAAVQQQLWAASELLVRAGANR